MLTLREVLSDADRRKVAIGHFNVSEVVALKAVAEAAQELNLPVGLESALGKQPEEVTPYKLLTEPLHAIKDLVRARLQLFHPMASGANL